MQQDPKIVDPAAADALIEVGVWPHILIYAHHVIGLSKPQAIRLALWLMQMAGCTGLVKLSFDLA